MIQVKMLHYSGDIIQSPLMKEYKLVIPTHDVAEEKREY